MRLEKGLQALNLRVGGWWSSAIPLNEDSALRRNSGRVEAGRVVVVVTCLISGNMEGPPPQ